MRQMRRGLGLLRGSAVGVVIMAATSLAPEMQSTVNPSEVHQTIDGFGASSSGLGDLNYPELTDAEADAFFSPTLGIGLSLCRARIPDATSGSGQSSCLKAAARGAKIWATPWSPPAKYKSTGQLNGGHLCQSNGDGSCTASHYQDWANALAEQALGYKNLGAPLYAISIQNEPDYMPVSPYPGCYYTSAQFSAFVPHLYSALAAYGVRGTKIVIGEQTSWAVDLASATLADPSARAQVSIVAVHVYSASSTISDLSSSLYGKPLWQTETSALDAFDGSITNALFWAERIHTSLVTGQVSAWHYWNLINNPGDNDNEGLTDVSRVFAKRAYALGNWSKFVRPGYRRIGATSDDLNVLVSAFKSPSGKLVVIAVNRRGSPVPSTFTLSGLTSTAMVPWLTSVTSNLTQQPSVDVTAGSFRYNLPASSLVTFVQADAVSPPAPPTPTPTAETSGSGGGSCCIATAAHGSLISP